MQSRLNVTGLNKIQTPYGATFSICIDDGYRIFLGRTYREYVDEFPSHGEIYQRLVASSRIQVEYVSDWEFEWFFHRSLELSA